MAKTSPTKRPGLIIFAMAILLYPLVSAFVTNIEVPKNDSLLNTNYSLNSDKLDGFHASYFYPASNPSAFISDGNTLWDNLYGFPTSTQTNNTFLKYLLANGSRALTGTWNVGMQNITGIDNITATEGKIGSIVIKGNQISNSAGDVVSFNAMNTITSGNQTMKYGIAQRLYDNSKFITIDLTNKLLYDVNRIKSLDFSSRTLYALNGVKINLDWSIPGLVNVFGRANATTITASKNFTVGNTIIKSGVFDSLIGVFDFSGDSLSTSGSMTADSGFFTGFTSYLDGIIQYSTVLTLLDVGGFGHSLEIDGGNYDNSVLISTDASYIEFANKVQTPNLDVTGNLNVSGNFSAKRPYWNGYDNSTQSFLNTANVQVVNISNNNDYDGWLIHIKNRQNITFEQRGDYQITFSPEFYQATGSNKIISFWIQKNGINAPWSNSRYTMANGQYLAPSITFQVDIENPATDNVRVMWYSDSTASQIISIGGLTSPTRPGVPGVILNIQKVSEITPKD